jgi:hypothetical protein
MPLTTRQMLHAATLAGAKALGLGEVCGSIDIGKSADLLFVRNDRLHMRPVIDPIDSIVMQATTRDVDRVLVAGRMVVENGRLPEQIEKHSIDLIESAHQRLTDRVMARGGWAPTISQAFLDEFDRNAGEEVSEASDAFTASVAAVNTAG